MRKNTAQLLIVAMIAFLAFGSLQFALASPRIGAAAVQVVDTLDDEDDGNCTVGDCSLREAIAAAAAGDTITFSVSGTISLSAGLGDLDIGQDVIIDGGGVIMVSGGNAVRVFNVTGGNVTFDGLTIADGFFTGAVLQCGIASDKGGGGILNDGASVTVLNSTFMDNSADCGGAILNDGTLTVSKSVFIGNSADFGSGGGIDNRSVATTTVTDSQFSGNSATQSGGAITNFGTLTVTRSTLNSNTADNWGGGIYSQNSIHVANSTLSDNTAADGGGINIFCADGSSTVDNSTLTENRVTNAGGGGGIATDGDGCSSGTITIGNSIISGNIISGTTTADDVASLFGVTNGYVSGGYNLIGTMGAGVVFAGPGDQTGINDPKIEPLADNGGDTLTHALMSDSLAIANGECSSGPATDQRGVARPQDDSCDVGAYEHWAAPVAAFSGTPTSGAAPLEVDFSDVSTGDIDSYSWDFGDGGNSTAANPGHTYTTSGDYTVSLTVTGPGGSDSETKVDYISVTDPPQPPIAEFSGTPTSGTVPLNVQFTDQSTGDISSRSWDFGDGGNSTATNPSHTYTTSGAYTVSLTVTGPGGSDSETKTNYISVADPAQPPIAEFSGTPTSGTVPLNVQFTDQSTGDISSRSWNFGDGGNSTATNPSHTYTTSGDYTVSLTVSGPGGSDSETKIEYISVTPPPCTLVVTNTQSSGPGSLRDALANICDGGQITFDLPGARSHYGSPEGGHTIDISPDGSLNVDKTVSINACANDVAVSISGGDAVRILTVENGGLSIDCLTLERGNANAEVDGGDGGAIKVTASASLTLTNSTVKNSLAVNGGGIFSLGSLKIDNSTFSDNEAIENGGGLQSILDDILIDTSNFFGNSAKNGGGLVNNGSLRITNSTLSDNSATENGGAIQNKGISIELKGSTISGNSAENGSAIHHNPNFCDVGGRNIDQPVSMLLEDLEIYNNTAGDATIDLTNVSTTGMNMLSINSLLANNTSEYSGGGMALRNILCPVARGGVDIATSSGFTVTLTGGTFNGNSAQTGGAIFNQGANVTVKDSTFSGNSATEDGGAIVNEGTLKIENSSLSDNEATENGGAIASEGPLTIIDSTLKNNSAINRGDALWGDLIILSVEGLVFEDDNVGGTEREAFLTLTNGASNETLVFETGFGHDTVMNFTTSGTASRQNQDAIGGDDIASSSGVTATLTGSTFSGLSGYAGAAIYNQGVNLIVNDSTFSGYSATENGGAILNDGGNTIVNNSTFADNSTAASGGAVHNESGSVTLNNSTLSNNQAVTSGGGISSSGNISTTTTLRNTIVAGNVISGTITANDVFLTGGSINSFSSEGYNLIGVMGPNVSFNGTGDITDVSDPMLGPLADNGGDTLTMALLPGSPAIDAGGDCDEPYDQRGVVRPQGIACDIGGYELEVSDYRIFLPLILR
jgi:CSLREA domain-containing protein